MHIASGEELLGALTVRQTLFVTAWQALMNAVGPNPPPVTLVKNARRLADEAVMELVAMSAEQLVVADRASGRGPLTTNGRS